MKQYLELLQDVMENGKKRQKNPQGIPDITVFGRMMRFNMADGFPLMTTKQVSFKNIVGEVLWFLSGDSRLDFLHRHNIHFWDQWATKEVAESVGLEEGDVGRIYGPQWVDWQTTDGQHINQIAQLVAELKKNPDSRRLKVAAWNPGDVDKYFLAPCHGDFKCQVVDGVLSLNLWQRSADLFIGVPYNIAFYSLLLHMLASVTGLKPGEFVHQLSDVHIYSNHFNQVKEQLRRLPSFLPTIWINPGVTDIFRFSFEDFQLFDYRPQSAIKAPVGL